MSLVVCLSNISSCSGIPEESPSGGGGGGGVLPVLWSGSYCYSPGDPGPGITHALISTSECVTLVWTCAQECIGLNLISLSPGILWVGRNTWYTLFAHAQKSGNIGYPSNLSFGDNEN